MEKYKLSEDQLSFINSMRQPFVICQFLNKTVKTLAVSDGFCELYGFHDRMEAYADMNRNMFRDAHPDDATRFTNALLLFAAEGGKLDVVYRTKK